MHKLRSITACVLPDLCKSWNISCNNGSCVNAINATKCFCNPGYNGARCNKKPLFCLTGTCLNGGTCHEITAGYHCSCPSGKTGTNCEIQHPCQQEPCDNNGTCLATNGDSYFCFCTPQFTGHKCSEPITTTTKSTTTTLRTMASYSPASTYLPTTSYSECCAGGYIGGSRGCTHLIIRLYYFLVVFVTL